MYNQKSLSNVRTAARYIIAAAAIASVTINVLHAWVFNGNGWSMGLAVFPPTFVIVSAEFISRVPIDRKRNWLRRWARPSLMLSLAFGGAWLSYFAQREVIMHYTLNETNARILPLLVDGFVLIMSLTVYELNERLMAMEVAKRSKEQGEVIKPESRRRNGSFSTREQIAVLLSKDPEMKPKDIATLMKISPGYASTLKKELQPELNGSELLV